jgi:hypothetical protein
MVIIHVCAFVTALSCRFADVGICTCTRETVFYHDSMCSLFARETQKMRACVLVWQCLLTLIYCRSRSRRGNHNNSQTITVAAAWLKSWKNAAGNAVIRTISSTVPLQWANRRNAAIMSASTLLRYHGHAHRTPMMIQRETRTDQDNRLS